MDFQSINNHKLFFPPRMPITWQVNDIFEQRIEQTYLNVILLCLYKHAINITKATNKFKFLKYSNITFKENSLYKENHICW